MSNEPFTYLLYRYKAEDICNDNFHHRKRFVFIRFVNDTVRDYMISNKKKKKNKYRK